MKTEIKTKPFSPVLLCITLESQKELDAMTALFNYLPVVDALNKAGLPNAFEEVCEKLSAEGGRESGEALETIKAHIEKRI